jgi:hypothetical protein
MYASPPVRRISWQSAREGVEAEMHQCMTERRQRRVSDHPAGVRHLRLSERSAEKASKAGATPFLTIYKEQHG